MKPNGNRRAVPSREARAAEKLFAEVYDSLPRWSRRPDRRFYRRCARAANGPVLELGCGTGRLLLPLAKAGCAVTGLDLSAPMLRVCRAKLRRLPRAVRRRVRIVRGDMTRFRLPQRFRAALIPFSGLQLLPLPGQAEACMRCAARHLEAGGSLALDVFHLPRYYFRNPPQREEPYLRRRRLPGGRSLRIAIRGDKLRQGGRFIETQFVLYLTERNRRERVLRLPLTLRHFSLPELRRMVRRCGLRVRRVSGDFRGGALRERGRIVLEAVKSRR